MEESIEGDTEEDIDDDFRGNWENTEVEAEYESFCDALSDSPFSVEGRKRYNLASEGEEWRQAPLNLPLFTIY